MVQPKLRALALLGVAALLPACGSGGGGTVQVPVASTVTLTALSAAPVAVAPSGSVVLTATAATTAGGSLTYAWTAVSGSLSSGTGNPVTWSAPSTAGNYSIGLSVTDANGSTTSGTAGVLVSFGPYGAVITSVTPSVATGGDEVIVHGAGYGATQGANTLTIDGIVAGIVSWSDTSIRATVPAAATSGPVLVQTTAGPSTPGALTVAWPAGNPANVRIAGSVDFQDQPQVLADGSGGAFIVWRDSARIVQAQRVNRQGVLQWASAGVQVSSIATGTYPVRIVSDGAGGVIIAWNSDGIFADILAQRLNGAGVPQWGSDGVYVCSENVYQVDPSIVSDGAGGAIISWMDARLPSLDIFAQRVDGSGATLWQTNGVPLGAAAGDKAFCRIIADGGGGAIGVWQDTRNGGVDLYAQRIDATGALQWGIGGIPVCVAGGNQSNQGLVPDGAGGAIIVWQDPRSGGLDVYAQRLNGAGVPQWAADGIGVCTSGGDQTLPCIAGDGAGGAILVWMDARAAFTDLFGQRLDGSGAALWAADGRAICTATGFQEAPQMVSDGAGGAVVTWRDRRSGGVGDIYSQRLDGAGTGLWTTNGAPVCTDPAEQYDPQLAPDGSGGAIVAWRDYRSGGGIFAQGIEKSSGR